MSKIILALLIAFFTMTSVNAQENEVTYELNMVASVTPLLVPPIVEPIAELAPLPEVSPLTIEYGNFTPNQIKLLMLAHDVGNEYGQAEPLQALLLQESSAGAGGREGGFHLPSLKRYYGIMQMKVSAVLDVLNTYPDLINKYFSVDDLSKISPKQIIKKLKTDDEFSLRMSVNYFVKYYEGSITKAIMTYNQGPAGVLKFRHPERHPYVRGVKKNLVTVKDFNNFVNKVCGNRC